MTIENCIIRYKKYMACGNTDAAKNTKAHMLAGNKFKKHKDYPFNELFGVKKEAPTPKPKEVKKDAKKPKG